MKQIISILLLLVISAQMLYRTGFTIYWKINQAALASKYCENKAKPQMHCNGKCYLKKQLNKATDNQQREIPASFYQQKLIDNFIVENIYRHLFAVRVAGHASLRYTSGILAAGYYQSLLQPPDVS